MVDIDPVADFARLTLAKLKALLEDPCDLTFALSMTLRSRFHVPCRVYVYVGEILLGSCTQPGN